MLRLRDRTPTSINAKTGKFTISDYRRRLDSFELIILELVIEFFKVHQGIVLKTCQPCTVMDVVESASINDISEMLELLEELGRPKPENKSDSEFFRYMLKRYIEDSDKEILVVKNDSKVIGMVSMMFLTRLNQKRPELYIPELIVSEDHQHRGVGKMLIDACVKVGKEKNCHRIRLESGNQRTDSHEFYKKNDFEQSGLSFTKAL